MDRLHWLTDRHTDGKSVDKQTNRNLDKQNDRQSNRQMQAGSGWRGKRAMAMVLTRLVDLGRPLADPFGALDRVPINNRGSGHVTKRLMRRKMTLPGNDPGDAGAIRHRDRHQLHQSGRGKKRKRRRAEEKKKRRGEKNKNRCVWG